MPRLIRHPMLLLIFGIPLASISAGVVTLNLVQSDEFDRVNDPVHRIGRVQQVELGPDQAALRVGAQAQLRVEDGQVRVLLSSAVPLAVTGPLELQLEHPAKAALDHRILLQAEDSAWVGHWPAEPAAWHLKLLPADGSWRVVGRWPGKVQSGELRLESALKPQPSRD